MMRSKSIFAMAGVIVAIVLSLLVGLSLAKEGGAKEKAAQEAKAASPYDMDIKPLSTVECAQCHYSVFEALKTAGGRHQIDCVRCHTQYHVYNPRKQNYDEIMPDCAACHKSASGGAFHGDQKALTPCLDCHADPHKPLTIPMGTVESACNLCHAPQAAEIKNFPSAHTTAVSCADCHADKHGFIPECSSCHQSHSPAVEMTSQVCMGCHPVHKPTQIQYAEATDSRICAGCHDTAFDLLQAKATGHTAVACSQCHPNHKEIPACSRCHGEPHPKAMMVDTSKCGDCHGIAHSLVK